MIDKIYLVLHSHVDIGFTHDQPIVWDLHGRFIEAAIEMAEKDAHRNGKEVFRWTLESAAMVHKWLETAPSSMVDRFMTMEKEGRLEVTAMYADIAPLYDIDQLMETFQPVKEMKRNYGLTITSAMNSDVNGQNWILVEALKAFGVNGFSMAINTHFGRAPKSRPGIFKWEGISGQQVLAYNGLPYGSVGNFGIGNKDMSVFKEKNLPRILKLLKETHYPLPILMLQGVHCFGDNGSVVDNLGQYVKAWNCQENQPKLVIATPRMWWEAVNQYSDKLTVCRGDWTDSWNFGSISAARELAVHSRNNVRLRNADALASIVASLDGNFQYSRTKRTLDSYRKTAWEAHNNFTEHTWGADCGVDVPHCEDVAAMWNHKANYAYTARSLSLLMQRDALSEFAHFVERSEPDEMLVFNPLPWARVISGTVPPGTDIPRGLGTDDTAGRHFQERKWDLDLLRGVHNFSMWGDQYPHSIILPTLVEGFGYAVVNRKSLARVHKNEISASHDTVVENAYNKLVFDANNGAIISWYDKQLNHEWVEKEAEFGFNMLVHERLSDGAHPWPRQLLYDMNWWTGELVPPNGWNSEWPAIRTGTFKLLSHEVYKLPHGIRVIQELEAPGCEGPLVQSIFLPDYDSYLEVDSSWVMGVDTHPQANYVYYPFNLKNAVARYDAGGVPVIPEKDQLEGVCRDFFTTQRWVDLSNDKMGMTIATPENPLFMLGDFTFGKDQQSFQLKNPSFIGWVTNNYWETNFRAHQPGQVSARYRFIPHVGGFNEASAHKHGLEAVNAQPLMHHLGEIPSSGRKISKTGCLLDLPSGEEACPVVTLHVKPDAEGKCIIVDMFNISGTFQKAAIKDGILKIKSAKLLDATDNAVLHLSVHEGCINFCVQPRQFLSVSIQVEA